MTLLTLVLNLTICAGLVCAGLHRARHRAVAYVTQSEREPRGGPWRGAGERVRLARGRVRATPPHDSRLARSHAVLRLWERPSAMFVSGRLPLAAHPQGGGVGRLTELPKVRRRQRSKPRLLCSTRYLLASDACS